MANFKLGDTVLCIDVSTKGQSKKGRAPALVLNKEYSVLGIRYCQACGIQIIDVGLRSPAKFKNCICGERSANNGDAHWVRSNRFIKPLTVKEESEIEELIKESLADCIRK